MFQDEISVIFSCIMDSSSDILRPNSKHKRGLIMRDKVAIFLLYLGALIIVSGVLYNSIMDSLVLVIVGVSISFSSVVVDFFWESKESKKSRFY
jgi:hypothetical protein